MKNQAIRAKAATCGICLWQIAEKLGITDSTFSRKLRRELPQEEQERILSIIDEISKEVSTCCTI